ncbi:MAG: hypothetical protein ACI9YM_002238 [Brevundimonas sp.]
MEYICYVEIGDSTVPVMDIIEADDISAVHDHVRGMMAEHPASSTATIYLGDVLIGSLVKDPTPASTGAVAITPGPALAPVAGIRPRR